MKKHHVFQQDKASCVCDLCWKYNWHGSAPWYAKVKFNVQRFLHGVSA